MMFETRFDLGDIVMCSDKANILFRRDCIVIYVDPTFFGVISDGLDEVYFVKDDDETFSLERKGSKVLGVEHSTLLEATLKKWPLVTTLSKFSGLVNAELDVLGVNKENTVRMAITATIPISLMNYWRRLRAVLEMGRMVHPEIPKDVEQLMATWAVMSAHKVVPVILTKNMLEGQ